MEVGMYSCEKSIRQMWMLNANSSLELFTTAIDTEATDGYMAKVRNLIIIIVTIIVTVIVIIFFLVWKIITNFHVYSTYESRMHTNVYVTSSRKVYIIPSRNVYVTPHTTNAYVTRLKNAYVTPFHGVLYSLDRKSTRLNSSHRR